MTTALMIQAGCGSSSAACGRVPGGYGRPQPGSRWRIHPPAAPARGPAGRPAREHGRAPSARLISPTSESTARRWGNQRWSGGGGSRTRVRSNIQRSRYVTFRIPCGGCRDLWSPSWLPVGLRVPAGCPSARLLQVWITPERDRPRLPRMPRDLECPGTSTKPRGPR